MRMCLCVWEGCDGVLCEREGVCRYVYVYMGLRMSPCVCVHACVRACMRACVCVCARVCVRV